ncbi:MAG: cation transporting ATPase C-terminal domain-containing protein [Leptolyngbyaceae cyanobacterium MO_188.B28]|nr:cation transporting ATPase C-terminal domain-containing protein [Leptolyngbyaceae cyanobacterium MO_188.B28]
MRITFDPGEGDALNRRLRSPRELIFNRLMIERTLIGAVAMGGISFAAFDWMLKAGWSEFSARNALLLLMVLFEIIHLGNSRSESKSAFLLSPFRSPILLIGTVVAFLIHVLMVYLPLGQTVLAAEPVSLQTWGTLFVLSLTVLAPIEMHKFMRSQVFRNRKKKAWVRWS